jgi:hypothetical protein
MGTKNEYCREDDRDAVNFLTFFDGGWNIEHTNGIPHWQISGKQKE